MLSLLAGTALALTLPAAGPASAIAPVARAPAAVPARASLSMGAVGADDFVPDMQRRTIMNLVLLGGAGVPVLWLAGGYIYFLVPPGGGGGGAGVTARDALGADVMAAKWIAANPYPGRALVEGLKGDAHYLIVKEDKTLYDFAINAVCALPAAAPLLSPQPCGLVKRLQRGEVLGRRSRHARPPPPRRHAPRLRRPVQPRAAQVRAPAPSASRFVAPADRCAAQW